MICGHIHHAERRFFDGIDYMNDGDWVESCTALVEYDDGRFEILHWADEVAAREEKKNRGKGKGKKGRKDKSPKCPRTPAPVAAE